MINIGSDITIYNTAGEAVLSTGFTSNCEHKRELMTTNHITLNFNLATNLALLRGYYIEYLGTRYTIKRDYQPTEKSLHEYNYEAVFEGPEMLLSDIICFYMQQGLMESEWSLTSSPRDFVQIIVDNINRYYPGVEIGTVLEYEAITLSFTANNVFDVASALAEAVGGEWIYDGRVFDLVERYEYGDVVPLAREIELSDIDQSNENNTNGITRLFAFGSTRNIPTNYREAGEGEAVEAIVQKRLRIPTERGNYIDIRENITDVEVIEHTEYFDDIYPRRVGTITEVRSSTSGTMQIFYIKDSNFEFSSEYILQNETLKLKFESGKLWGREFELSYNNSTAEYEIINDQSNTELIIPNEYLAPAVGDKYVLFNFDISLVSAQYVPAAEEELYTAAVQWLADQNRDLATYTCECVAKTCFEKQIDLEIGRRVKLVSNLFADGEKTSRIFGYTKKLWNRYICTYTVGDVAKYSRLAALTTEVEEAKQTASEQLRNIETLRQYTERSYAIAAQSLTSLQEAQLLFDQKIQPITVQTMQLVAGDPLLQFTFEPTLVVVWNINTHRLEISGGELTHQTLGIDTIMPGANENRLKWTLSRWESVALDKPDEVYYIYARVKIGATAAADNTFLLSTTALKLDNEQGYYHLLIGLLSNEFNNERIYTRYYGYSSISPGLIETNKLQSANGKLIIDLEHSRIIAVDGAEIIAPSITIATELATEANITASSAEAKASELDYLKNATEEGQATFKGGVVLSSVFGVTEAGDAPILENIKGGISGLKEDNIAFFADGKGAYEKAVKFLQDPTNLANMLNFLVTDAGVAYMKNAHILQGTFEDCYIEKGWFDKIGTKKEDGTFDERISISPEQQLWLYGVVQHQGADALFLTGDTWLRGQTGIRGMNYGVVKYTSVEKRNYIDYYTGQGLFGYTIHSYQVSGYNVDGNMANIYPIPVAAVNISEIIGASFNNIVFEITPTQGVAYTLANYSIGQFITLSNPSSQTINIIINQVLTQLRPKESIMVTAVNTGTFDPGIVWKYIYNSSETANLGEGLMIINRL